MFLFGGPPQRGVGGNLLPLPLFLGSARKCNILKAFSAGGFFIVNIKRSLKH